MNGSRSNSFKWVVALLLLVGLGLILLLQSCNGDDDGGAQPVSCPCDLIGPETESQGLNQVQVRSNTCIDEPCETNVTLDILDPGNLTSQQAQALASKGQLYSQVLDIQPDGHTWDPPIEVQFQLNPAAPQDDFKVTIFQWQASDQDWFSAGTATADSAGDTIAVGTISHTSLFALVDTQAEVPAEAPVAEFDAQTREGGCEFEVQFVNLSTGADAFFWDFGDGQTSDEREPLHVYTVEEEGSAAYTVTLVAEGPGGQAREIKEDFIQAQCIQ